MKSLTAHFNIKNMSRLLREGEDLQHLKEERDQEDLVSGHHQRFLQDSCSEYDEVVFRQCWRLMVVKKINTTYHLCID